jgi:hypothetical protein
MTKPLSLIGQAIAYAAFGAMLGYFSAAPAYVHRDPNMAQIKISFSHAAHRIGKCRRLSPEEIAKLAPNMRRPLDCPRERLPILVELELDNRLLYRGELPPTGLARDGSATIYQRFSVKPGKHHLVARLRDSKRTTGFDYEGTADIELAPRQNFVVEFRAETGGFIFK